MHFSRVRPEGDSSAFVEWYWTTESTDPRPHPKKIIPDGYPECIFHYGDPYRIKLHRRWQKQSPTLLGGQQRKFFFLENTGRSGMFGITWKPAALTHLLGLRQSDFTDRVVSLNQVPGQWKKLIQDLGECRRPEDRIRASEQFIRPRIREIASHPVERSLQLMQETKGAANIATVCGEVGVTERQLQRIFHSHVGLAPKYYARILRFNHIFSLIQEGQVTWSDVVFLSGYYDQSHFIRDFKKFTGEDPTAYPFKDESLTNFFAKKSSQRKLSGLYNAP